MQHLIDIGANLTNKAFASDLEHVIERAKEAGVATIMVTGTSVAASRGAVTLATGRAPMLYATAGVHPHDASAFTARTTEELRALAGEPAVRAVGECGRAVSAGESPQAIIAALQRHFQRLHRVRSAMDSGSTLDDALRRMRPPLHFKQKDAFAAQCRMWTTPRLSDALGRISTVAKAARLAGGLDEALSERLLMGLAMMVRDTGSRPR